MNHLQNSLKTVNNLVIPLTIIICLTGGLLIKLDLLNLDNFAPQAEAQAITPKVASFPFRNRVKTKVNSQATDTYLDVPYINQCKDSENSSLWPDAIGANIGVDPNRRICENMCGAASAVMLLSYFGNYHHDLNNPRILRNKLIDDRPDITDVGRDGNATFGGAFTVTSSLIAGRNASSYEGIVKLMNNKKYMYIDINGKEIINRLDSVSSSTIYNRVKIAIDRGNPIIVSTNGHIRLAIGYDNKGNIIANDPWNNNNKTDNRFASLDGRFVKYNNSVQRLGQEREDQNAVDPWLYTLEFTQAEPPAVKTFVHGQRVKSYQRFSDDPIEGLNVRTTPGGSVIKRIPWKTGGVITWGPSYGGQYWAYKVLFDDRTEGWVSEIYIRDINYNPTSSSYAINQEVYSRLPDGVNIREEPVAGSKLIKFQPSMQKGKATRRVDNVTDYNWFYIEWQDGTKGWSAVDFISTIYQAPRKIDKSSWVNWETNLRDSNTTKSNILKKCPKGTYVWVIEEAGNADGFEWVKVIASETPFWNTGELASQNRIIGYMIKQNLNEGWVSYDGELYTKNIPYITKTIDPLATELNVRENPNGTSTIQDTLPWGTEVTIVDGVTYSYGYNRVKIRYIRKPTLPNLFDITVTGWVPVEFLQKK